MNTRTNNLKDFKAQRKALRNQATPAEALLWKGLQRSQLEGRKFRRQHGIGPYVLDFYCPAEKLCVELDGQMHLEHAGVLHDEERTRYLNNLGIKVIRFENSVVFQNPEGVLEEIKTHFRREKPPLSPP
jgi:very-short-patch-repair endonuclease